MTFREMSAGDWSSGCLHKKLSALGRVLGFAVAKRPVFFLDLDKIDKNVLAPQPDSRVKAVGNSLVERLFLFCAPSFVPGDLDNHELLGAVDTDIIGVEQEVLGLVLANDLEAVILRHADADERLIHDAADFLAVGRVLAFAKIDTNEWHNLFLFF